MPRVLVLLSTYNGEQYIRELLNSVLAQHKVDVTVLIRDDGSTDQTWEILEYFKSKNKNILLYRGDNLGAKESFFNLIHHVYDKNLIQEYDYFSFCDQDDIWMPMKLMRALSLLKSGPDKNKPLMFCSTTKMVDETLKKITIWPPYPKKSTIVYNALVENIAVGCTTVINREAFELVVQNFPDNSKQIIMHDWWLYLCVSAFGNVIFDKEPNILYRQHSHNVTGGQKDSPVKKMLKRFYRFIKKENYYIRRNQAVEFYKCFYSLLNSEDRKAIECFLNTLNKNLPHRVLYIYSSPFFRQTKIDNEIFKLTYIFGKV
ncbi:hypothetical protein PDUR_24870 [Paenibacillus durus]|uniref:Glycosyltransferase 2-like domain-containing protein n=1 Tax=Paenibacillus durus TaxID=44251 RepID=A0A089HUH4_PAEDU|nr:hypothetical protein PDUR_24870 [Paenibacillus durus]